MKPPKMKWVRSVNCTNSWDYVPVGYEWEVSIVFGFANKSTYCNKRTEYYCGTSIGTFHTTKYCDSIQDCKRHVETFVRKAFEQMTMDDDTQTLFEKGE